MEVLDHGFVELVSATGHVGTSVLKAARCSYGKTVEEFTDADRKLVAYLLGHGHTSPFRHAMFTFHVKAPLFVFRQWWKYQVGSTWREYETTNGQPLTIVNYTDRMREINRILTANTQERLKPVEMRALQEELAKLEAENRRPCTPEETAKAKIKVHAVDIQTDTDKGCSWNELSGRYKVLEPEFYVPVRIRSNTGRQAANDHVNEGTELIAIEAMKLHNDRSMELYRDLLDRNVAKEIARLVLPPTIYSECYWTVSLQAVLHFLEQRLAEDAQFEIRQYAKAILDLVRPQLAEMGIEINP
jgi:thymidylate synthase (FAD)